MNFLNFLTAGASIFNFNLQNLASSSISNHQIQLPIPKLQQGHSTISNQDQAIIKQQMQLLATKQQLINQYMHLNIQMLNQKLQTIEKNPEDIQKPISKQDNSSQERKMLKKNKKIIKCGHDDKQHYAKGLCNNCYHKYGRTKKPTKCSHQKLYAAGMCQNCYINSYNRKKRETKDISLVQNGPVGPKFEESNIDLEQNQQKGGKIQQN